MWDGLVRDLCGQTAKIIDRLLDLAVRLGALQLVQLHRRATETPIGAPRNRYHYCQITIQFHQGWRGRLHCMLPLCLQKQLRLIQKPFTHRSCCSSPGGI